LCCATIATACSPSIASPLAARSGHRADMTGKGVTRAPAGAGARDCFDRSPVAELTIGLAT
jgi:hypothetical protein